MNLINKTTILITYIAFSFQGNNLENLFISPAGREMLTVRNTKKIYFSRKTHRFCAFPFFLLPL